MRRTERLNWGPLENEKRAVLHTLGELERVKNKLKDANAQASPTRRKVEDLLADVVCTEKAAELAQAIYKTQMALEQQQTLPNKLRDIAMTGKTRAKNLKIAIMAIGMATKNTMEMNERLEWVNERASPELWESRRKLAEEFPSKTKTAIWFDDMIKKNKGVINKWRKHGCHFEDSFLEEQAY